MELQVTLEDYKALIQQLGQQVASLQLENVMLRRTVVEYASQIEKQEEVSEQENF